MQKKYNENKYIYYLETDVALQKANEALMFPLLKPLQNLFTKEETKYTYIKMIIMNDTHNTYITGTQHLPNQFLNKYCVRPAHYVCIQLILRKQTP